MANTFSTLFVMYVFVCFSVFSWYDIESHLFTCDKLHLEIFYINLKILCFRAMNIKKKITHSKLDLFSLVYKSGSV